jgi:hypothetical protein
MYCRSCGSHLLSPKDFACSSCGAPPKDGNRFCFYCSAPTSPQDVACTSCGEALVDVPRPAGVPPSRAKAILSGVLNLIFPGIGYFVIGQVYKGVVLTAVSYLLYFVIQGMAARNLAVSLLTFSNSFGAMLLNTTAMIIGFAYRLGTIVDVVMVSERIDNGEAITHWSFFNL